MGEGDFGDLALQAAQKGDWDPLADYIEKGFEITPVIREFLVKILHGERRPKKGRPHSAKISLTTLRAAALDLVFKEQGVREHIQRTKQILRLDHDRAMSRAVAALPNLSTNTNMIDCILSIADREFPNGLKESIPEEFIPDRSRGKGWTLTEGPGPFDSPDRK